MAYQFSDFKLRLKEAEEWLSKEYTSLRTGRATPALLDGINVESYGARMPLSSVATISVEDARTIRIAPWDMSQVQTIEKAIIVSSLGLSPIVDDKGVRVVLPELSADRRTTLIKAAKDHLESTKVRIRQEREKVLKDIQAEEKEGEFGKDEAARYRSEVDKLVKDANTKCDEHLTKKEKEIHS